AGMRHRRSDWRERMAAWEEKVARDPIEWTILPLTVDDISTSGQKYTVLPDGSLLAGGYAPTKVSPKFTATTSVRNITGFRLELLTDPNLPMGGPGRSDQGMCALTEFRVTAEPVDRSSKPVNLKFASATADIALPETELG